MARYTRADVDGLNESVRGPEAALRWASESLHPRVAKASSFGREDSVIIHMMAAINPGFRYFTLDTGRLPEETYEVMGRLVARYKMDLRVAFPDAADVEGMVAEGGPNLFYDSPEGRRLCCEVRKVRPLRRMLEGLDGWITGLRAAQPGRGAVRAFEIDEANGGILKISPLAGWTSRQVSGYIAEHGIPYSALFDRGYASVGCAPCTRPVPPGGDERSGRWWWEAGGSPKECGLHAARGGA